MARVARVARVVGRVNGMDGRMAWIFGIARWDGGSDEAMGVRLWEMVWMWRVGENEDDEEEEDEDEEGRAGSSGPSGGRIL